MHFLEFVPCAIPLGIFQLVKTLERVSGVELWVIGVATNLSNMGRIEMHTHECL